MTTIQRRVMAKVADALRPERAPEESGGRTVIDQVDAGVSVKAAYDVWAAYERFSPFLDPARALVLEDTPKERIVWRSRIGKGHVDGAVTFHRLADDLTRIVVVLELQPRGPVERVRAVLRPIRRQLRAELAGFQQRVMTDQILHTPVKQGKKRKKKKG